MIIENLSGITAGSPMVGTPIILVRRPINSGLIKDLWIMPLRPKTSEIAKEQEGKVEPPGIEPTPLAYRVIALPLSYNSHWLQTKIIGIPTIGLPAVIPLRFSMIITMHS